MALLCLGAAAVASVVCALSLGTPYVPPVRLPATLGSDGLAGLVVTELRLPRMVLALIAGACLGAAGLVLQEALRNPLAVPEMLGVSSGAALGVAAPLVLALTVPLGLQPFLALAGAALGGLLTLVAAGFGRSPSAVLLTGAAVAAALQAALLVLMVMADQLDLQLIYRYLLGSLSARTWDDVTGLLPWLAVAVPALVLCVPVLGVLRLGDDDARALGRTGGAGAGGRPGHRRRPHRPRRRGLRTGGLGRLPRPARRPPPPPGRRRGRVARPVRRVRRDRRALRRPAGPARARPGRRRPSAPGPPWSACPSGSCC
ncbi:FecCD transport family protein [Streptomyces sp. Ncost-T6T-2b]|nr:FecCD transport family protein [Streptomyces sp. Ncost-T6T-2b]